MGVMRNRGNDRSRKQEQRTKLTNVSECCTWVLYKHRTIAQNMSTNKLANRTSDEHSLRCKPILLYDRSERSRHTSKGAGGNFIFTRKIATIHDRNAKRRLQPIEYH